MTVDAFDSFADEALNLSYVVEVAWAVMRHGPHVRVTVTHGAAWPEDAFPDDVAGVPVVVVEQPRAA